MASHATRPAGLVDVRLEPGELRRIRRAARMRRLSIHDYVKAAAVFQSDQDLASERNNPHARRRSVERHPVLR